MGTYHFSNPRSQNNASSVPVRYLQNKLAKWAFLLCPSSSIMVSLVRLPTTHHTTNQWSDKKALCCNKKGKSTHTIQAKRNMPRTAHGCQQRNVNIMMIYLHNITWAARCLVLHWLQYWLHRNCFAKWWLHRNCFCDTVNLFCIVYDIPIIHACTHICNLIFCVHVCTVYIWEFGVK